MISHFTTELVKEYQTSRRECPHSGRGLQVLSDSEGESVILVMSGNQPGLGGGHLDPATAAQYSHLVAGAGHGYEMYKGRESLQTLTYSPHSNGVLIFLSQHFS